MNQDQVDSLAHATMAHALIQLAVHFPEELEALDLDVPAALGRALHLAEDAIRRAPELPDGHTALGRLLLCHDDPRAADDAIEVLQHALELDPEHDPAEVALATAFWARGEEAAALEHVERVLRRGSGQAQPLLLRALLHLDAGRTAEACRDLERAGGIAPEAGLFALDAARAAAAAGDASRAESLRERSRELLGETFAWVDQALK